MLTFGGIQLNKSINLFFIECIDKHENVTKCILCVQFSAITLLYNTGVPEKCIAIFFKSSICVSETMIAVSCRYLLNV